MDHNLNTMQCNGQLRGPKIQKTWLVDNSDIFLKQPLKVKVAES